MRIGIRKAHTKNCYGATGYIDEWVESRNLFPKVVELLKPYHTIVDCTPDESLGWGEWNTGIKTANASKLDLFFSLHFNSAGGDPRGVEACVYSTSGTAANYAKKVIDNIASLGFTNRGLKQRTDLAETAKISCPSFILETCFVQESDGKLYKQIGIEKIARAIANAIDSRISLNVSTSSTSSSTSTSTSSSTASKTANFINKLAPLAVEDYKTSKVLPSLTIAQGILESGWGESELAVKANNLFGIKADSRWTGKIYNTETKEYYNGSNTATTASANFRSYDSWEGGVKDHSEFLQADRYSKVINAKDYKTACEEVYKAGYATDPQYTSKLIKLIEDFELHQYDTANTSSSTSSATSELYRVRKSWEDASSQKGAYSVLNNAITEAKKYSGYKVFNSAGKQVYPEVINNSSTSKLIKTYAETGKATVTGASSLNVRSSYKIEDSEIVASYSKGEYFYYDTVYISEYKGIQYVWCVYKNKNGIQRFVCSRKGNNRYLTCV